MSQVSNALRNAPLEAIRGGLIVSCQASEGDPLDDLDTLTRIATSVLLGGASGLRAEGVTRIAAFRSITQLPIIGIVKTYDANGDVYITPDFQSAQRSQRSWSRHHRPRLHRSPPHRPPNPGPS